MAYHGDMLLDWALLHAPSDTSLNLLTFQDLASLQHVNKYLRESELWDLTWKTRIRITDKSELARLLRRAIEAGKADYVRLIVRERPDVLKYNFDDGNSYLTIASCAS
jgi:hypothetical protein